MSEQSEVRPEVVEAIVGVLKGGDPADLPPGATAAEKAAAKDTYLSDFVAERGKRDRQSQAWELLLNRSYDESPSWKQIFDDLDPEVHARARRPSTTPCRPAPRRSTCAASGSPPASEPPRPHDPSCHDPRPPRRGALSAEVADRRRRHGHRVAGARRAARPRGRDQAGALPARGGGRRGRPAAAAGAPGGPDRGSAEPSARDLGLRRRAGVGPAVAGHGVPALAQPRGRARRGRRPARRPGRPDRGPGRRRAGGHARRGDRAPGRQAGQHPDRPGRPDRGPGQDHRLRHLARQRRRHAHPDRADHRDAGLPGPRGRPGPGDDRGQ